MPVTAGTRLGAMQSASGGIGANTQAAAAPQQQQRVEGIVDHNDNDQVEIVDLKTCKPKGAGRSMMWTENLFVLDALKRPVCTVCGVVVSVGSGVSISNTTNLFNHYESPKADAAHQKVFEEARTKYKGKGLSRGQKSLAEVIDLKTCTPKSAGRSIVWTEKLFVLDALKRPVCTCCGVVVSAGNGVSSNTTNLFNHYESPKVDESHQKTIQEARAKQLSEFKEGKGKAPPPPRAPQTSDGTATTTTTVK